MPRRVPITLNFGRKDKVAPKYAPHGVLKSVKNMRHRELGGLGMRHGYVAQPMTTAAGTLVAHDLHEYLGRLVALGSDLGEGYPHGIYEFTGLANDAWRRVGIPYSVSPLTNAREVAGIPQLQGGVAFCDAVSGGGYTLLVYAPREIDHAYALIVDSETNATIHFEDLTDGALGGEPINARVAFAGSHFFAQVSREDGALILLAFEPGVDSAFSVFATVDGASASALTAQDLVAVTSNTTAVVCSAFDRGASSDLTVKVYQADGSQLGSTITLSVDATGVAIDADQADNTILVLTTEAANAQNLRTLDFSGSVVAGPTAMTTGSVASVARRAGGASADTAYVGVYDNQDYVIQSCNADTHGSLATVQTIANFRGSTRLLSIAGPTLRLLVGGPSEANSGDRVSNALFFIGPDVVHQFKRDYLNADYFGIPLLHLSYDGERVTWCSEYASGELGNHSMPTVTLVDFASTERVQAVTYGGLRYFAGAAPWLYDGRAATEVGFIEPPVILSATPSVSGTQLTEEATYTWVAHWEVSFADGSFIESAPSLPVSATLAVGDNSCDVTVTGPHTLHTVLGAGALGASITLVLSRTEWSPSTIDVATGLPGAQFSQFRRSVETDVSADVATYGAEVTVNDNVSDETLADRGVIYTQAERGAFSGSLPHDAPQACRYITATESRLLTGGLLRPHEVQVSKEAFIGQPFSFSELSNFFGLVSGSVLGVYALDGAKLVFTSDDIYALREGAPDDEGKGALGLPVRIPAPSGLKDWRSLVEMSDGLACQLDDDKLFRIPRGGGAPVWFGADIVKLLVEFPTITAAARSKADNAVLFALVNFDDEDSRIAVRDSLFESWLVDEPPLDADGTIEALTVYGRTVAYISGGVLYTQSDSSFADEGSAFITCQLVTQPVYPFGVGGYGIISDLMVSAEFRGACVLSARVSYDDGASFVALPTSYTVSGLTSGAPVRRKWSLPTEATSSIVIELTVSTNGAPSEGLILNEITLLAEPTEGLPDLLPAEEG